MNLPPLPPLPEKYGIGIDPETYWTVAQLRTYAEQYGRLCAEAAAAELDRLQARVAELEALAVEAIVIMDALVRKSDSRLDRNSEIAAVCAWKIKTAGGAPIMQPLEALAAAIDTARKAKP